MPHVAELRSSNDVANGTWPPSNQEDDIATVWPPALRDWALNPDGIPRPVSAVAMKLVTKVKEQPAHIHRKAQLIVTVRGLISCEAAKGLWIVPSQCGLWVPGNVEHSVRSAGDVELYVLFVEPHVACRLPSQCCTISVSPLLRELVIRLSHLPRLYEQRGANHRLIQTMLDQLIAAPVEYSHLPIPADQRLRWIARALMTNRYNRITAAEWAHKVSMSERSLCRLTCAETGMTFGRWCRQLQIMLAVERLAEGQSVQSVALDLGYESASAFITMFRKTLGLSPAKYIAARRGRGES